MANDLLRAYIEQRQAEASKAQAGFEDELAAERKRQADLQSLAQQAFQQYSGAMNAPLPELNPLPAGVQQLFGDVGSVLANRPEFAQRSREDIQQRGRALMQQRMQNVQALRDSYLAQAEKVGQIDPVRAIELREKADRAAKTLETMHEAEISGFREGKADERAKLASDTDLEVARIRAQADRDVASMSLMSRMTATTNPMTATERASAINDIFKRNTVKGKIVGDTRTQRAMAVELTGLSPAPGQGAVAWKNEMTRLLSDIRNRKTPTKEDLALIRFRLLQHFSSGEPAPEDTTGTEGALDLNAPAVEAPGTPPDAALELIDEANELLPELEATGGLAATRRQQAQRRLNQIRAILRNRFKLDIQIPQRQGEITLPETVVR